MSTTKRRAKYLLAFVAAAVLALAMAVPAFAADPTGSITVKSNDTVSTANKSFKAYKILDATFSEDGQNVAYTVPSEMKSFYNNYFKSGENDVEAQAAAAGKTFDQVVSEKIAALTTASQMQDFVTKALAAAKTANITGTESNANVISGLASGYYIVEDLATEQPISSLMLDTVNNANVDIVVKANVPTPEKKIVVGTGTADANNAGVGQTVNYVVNENVPNYAGYDRYYFILHDTLSSGLTFNNDIKVTVGGQELTAGTDYYVYTGADAVDEDGNQETFQIAFADIKQYAVDADIVVTYSAQVNSNAVTGVNPNTNKVNTEYSNNPGKSGAPETETKPGKPNNTTDNPTGVGPTDWTETFTTEIDITKIDGATQAALPGVEFTLTGTSKITTVVNQQVFTVDANGTYWLLNDGTYTTQAPQTEAIVEEAESGATSGWVVAESGYEGSDARVIGETTYRPYQDGDTGTVYIIKEANSDSYKSTTVKYKMETASTQQETTVPVTMVGTTDASGKLVFKQLGEGTYVIEETGVPAGYNKIANITVAIDCTEPTNVTDGTQKATWAKATTGNVNADRVTVDENGHFVVTIENNKGTELPSTGGIGTTILYVIGGILVLGAVVFLITKRRMAKVNIESDDTI